MATKHVDWVVISAEYRLGIRTLRAIAADHDISHVSIAKRAKAEGWPRDRAAQIRAKADMKVNKAAVTTLGNKERAESTQREVEDAVVNQQVQVRMKSRVDITRLETLVTKLMTELEAETDDPALFRELGKVLDQSGPDGTGRWKQDKRNELYGRVISTSWRMDAAKKLVDMFEKLVRLKFYLFGITAVEQVSSPIDDLLKKIHQERIAEPVRS